MSAAGAVKPRSWTRGDYARMLDAGILGPDDRVELLDGEIVEMSPEKSRHAAAVDLAAEALRQAFGPGFAVRVQHPLALGDDSEPEPDVAVVRGSPRDYALEHPTSALLVVEVSASSLDYDRTRKAALYARAAIPEYWILDLTANRLLVHRDPAAADYGSRKTLVGGAQLTALWAPGRSIAVADLLP